MISKDFMMSEMAEFLSNMRKNKVDGFMAGIEDCNFNPEVGLYNIKGKPVAVVVTTDGSKTLQSKAIRKLVKKHKAVATITTADARLWDKDGALKGESLVVWIESFIDDLNGLGLQQPYSIQNGHLAFGDIMEEAGLEPIEGGLSGFFKKYH